jgi:alkanesulfonate monooxygenase SsuD/methylene tetrahydromethanopterin reductase-like flavin-dependent oxidoreductase (luciferase family)
MTLHHSPTRLRCELVTSVRPLIGVALDGAGSHPASWLEPDADTDGLFGAERLVHLVQTAEAIGVDFVTLDDSLALQEAPTGAVFGHLDAHLSLARVAPVTSRIGLLPTITVTHTEPFHTSKNVASLDLISGGRAGWRVKVSRGQAEADHIGRKQPASGNELADEAHDAIEVARRLWDSWEDDAVIRDRPTGRYIDRDKLHYIDFEGSFFNVRGPSITPRPPQGQPVVAVTVTASSTPEVALAAGQADLVVLETADLDVALLARRCVVRTAAEQGRDPSELRFVVAADVLIGTDEQAARRERQQLDDRVRAPSRAVIDLVASGEQVVDFVERVTGAGIDGVLFQPARLPRDVHLLGSQVLPQFGGWERSPQATFRQRLGLERPSNRYEVQEIAT